jgi:2-dehydropantoate 2-reductase
VIWAQNGIPWWYFQSADGPLAGTVLESVDPGGVISDSIAPEHSVGCVVYVSAEIVEPGVIRHVEGTRFSIGEPDGTASERCRSISHAFAAGGLKAPLARRLRDEIWLKLAGNVAFNPVAALTRATLAELGTSPGVVAVLRSLLAECGAVAEQLGIRFPVSLDRRLEAGLAVGDHKPSMLQDLEAGRPLELDCLTGALIEVAEKLGVDIPNTRTVHACTDLLDRVSRGELAANG